MSRKFGTVGGTRGSGGFGSGGNGGSGGGFGYDGSAVTSLGVLADQRIEQQLRLLEISEMLGRKLDLELLLECFFTETQSILRYDALQYITPAGDKRILVGNCRQHQRKFSLQLSERCLGELSVQSGKPRTARDDKELDQLVASLIYPLRNALDFHLAEQSALIDPFTGIHNHVALDKLLPVEMRLARRAETPLSVLVLDLDHFQKINQSHGQQIGDELIKAVCDTLSDNLRLTDVIFRLEQDSFVILLGDTDFEGASLVSERMRTSIDTCFAYENVQLLQNASAGVTEMVESDTSESLLERASLAMLNAKRAGRNRIRSLSGVA